MTSVKTILHPQGPKEKLFFERQEYVRKDVERAFGVLQAGFAIICGPTRYLDRNDLALIMKVCVTLHNMIIEDKCDSYDLAYDYEYMDGTTAEPNVRSDDHPCYTAYLCKVA